VGLCTYLGVHKNWQYLADELKTALRLKQEKAGVCYHTIELQTRNNMSNTFEPESCMKSD